MKAARRPVLDLLSSLTLDGGEPAYAQIAQQLKMWIEEGDLPPGTTLPSERKLAELVGVSRITVQHSYNLLRQSKMIASHGRLGSIVEGKISSPMNMLRGFTDEMRHLGRVPSSIIRSSDVVRDSKVATIMALASNAALVRLNRLRLADDVPMSNEMAWYNLEAAPFLEGADLSGSVYQLLAQNGTRLVRCEQSIEAVLPNDMERDLFGFIEITPCVLIKRTSFDAMGRVLEYVEGTFRGDIYSYRMNLDA